MQEDKKKQIPNPESDFLEPSVIAQLASRIYNEIPGSSEIPRSQAEAIHSPDNFGQTAINYPDKAGNIATEKSNLNDGALSSLPGINKNEFKFLNGIIGFDKIPYSTDKNELAKQVANSGYYFLSEPKPGNQEPLSNHADNLISQQTFAGNEEHQTDLTHFVKKVQSVSGGLPEPKDNSLSSKLLSQDLAGNHPDFTFLYARSQGFNQELENPGSPNGYYFINEPKSSITKTEFFDVQTIRKDFPILHQSVHGKPLIWFDNAATTQKPKIVIDTLYQFYSKDNSNIHRSAHALAARSTDGYEGAREKVRNFINAGSTEEIIFVRGTTEGINLVAQTWGRQNIFPGDEILISLLEHHANIIPWQMLAKEKGASLKAIPVNDNGEILMDEYVRLLNPRVKLLAITQASNGLGTILPVAEMIKLAKRYDIKVLVDGAQSVAHIPVNVQELDTDFFVFSGHKIFSPNGIGVVYGKKQLLENMPPWQGGGNMIQDVRLEETKFNGLPNKFEAGTPNVGDAIGLGVALDYVSKIGLHNIATYEHGLTQYGTQKLLTIPGLRLIGTAKEKVGVLSFVLPNIPTEQVGKYLDQEGIAVRAGHHCTQPSLRRFGVESTVRPSFSFYNTKEEIDTLTDVLMKLQYKQF